MAPLCCLFFLFMQGSMGLQCLTCTHREVDSFGVGFLDKTLSIFQDPFNNVECAYATGVQKDVTLETCNDIPRGTGLTNRCGDIDIKYKTSDAKIPRHVHIRGCLIVGDELEGGCHSDYSIVNQQNDVILSKAKYQADSRGFHGQVCINTPEMPNAWQYHNAAGNYSKSTCVIFLCCLIVMFVKK